MKFDQFEQFEHIMKSRPHVVILGAGASCAAIPKGDKNGRRIAAMSGFIDKLGLQHIISKVSVHTKSDNLEDIYMELDERSKGTDHDSLTCEAVKNELEGAIRSYMQAFELPDTPTVYDYLILSLTKKDLIATFNWDPLLVQAYRRCSKITLNHPQLVFLHGNVAVAYCEDDGLWGDPGTHCPKCGEELKTSKLLFPIKNKDYHSDPSISKAWMVLQKYMQYAYMITIVGYSAPKSDVEAVAMMKQAWGKVEDRNLEEISLIDIRDEDDVIDSWTGFIHTHHFEYNTSFFDSYLGKLPRRTCEATFDRLMNNRWLDSGGKGFTENMSWKQIEDLINPLLKDEVQHPDSLTDPYLA